MSGLIVSLVFIAGLGAMFGFIYLIDRKSKTQERTGKPSRLIRVSALVIGLMGIGLEFFVDWRLWLAIPAIIILLGYGIFGLFGTVKPQPTGEPPEKTGTPDNVVPVTRKGWSKTKKTILGGGIAIIILMCTGAVFIAYTARDTGMLAIEVNYPKTVQVGDYFELTLSLHNKGEADIRVQDIDLSPAVNGNYDSILAGASVTRTEPAMESYEVSLVKMRDYHYDRVIKPGETQKVIFYSQAVKAGVFDTDIDLYLSDSHSAVSDILISVAP